MCGTSLLGAMLRPVLRRVVLGEGRRSVVRHSLALQRRGLVFAATGRGSSCVGSGQDGFSSSVSSGGCSCSSSSGSRVFPTSVASVASGGPRAPPTGSGEGLVAVSARVPSLAVEASC